MGRWRPPQQRGSNYITAEGAEALQAELARLWKVERPQVTNVVHEAAKNGDRSENGDYIYGKRRLAEIDRRVRYLNRRLEELTVVYDKPRDLGKIFFAAFVELEDNAGNVTCYRIVGPDEFDLRKNKLSMDSPLAQAMLGKRTDDEVVVSTPDGEHCYTIVSIRY